MLNRSLRQYNRIVMELRELEYVAACNSKLCWLGYRAFGLSKVTEHALIRRRRETRIYTRKLRFITTCFMRSHATSLDLHVHMMYPTRARAHINTYYKVL